MPLQVGCVPWVEGSGMGSTSCGALENPGEGGVELALPIFAGSELGAEGDRGFLGTRGAHAEDGTERQVFTIGRGRREWPCLPFLTLPSLSSPHSVVYRGG